MPPENQHSWSFFCKIILIKDAQTTNHPLKFSSFFVGTSGIGQTCLQLGLYFLTGQYIRQRGARFLFRYIVF